MSQRFGRGPSRRLVDCCRTEGIPLQAAHSALGDATATAQLLKQYLDRARQARATDLVELGCHPVELPLGWTAPTGRGFTLARPSRGIEDATRNANTRISLAGVAARVAAATTGDTCADAYLDVLDRALADRVLSHAEAESLIDVARTWGLSVDRIRLLHQQYLAALADEAAATGSQAELADLAAHLRELTRALEPTTAAVDDRYTD